MEALVTFISIVFGIAVVVGVERLAALGPAQLPMRERPELVWNAIALLIASAGFAVIFSVPRNLAPGALLTAAAGWVIVVVGNRFLPSSFAAFSAALSVALVGNLLARITQRPSQVFILPAMVLLVPGSFGFTSLESFLRGDLLGGAAKGFEMFLTAGAIVTALLVGNVVLPPRKLL
jgi:uncharacterized membrane protein YjjB (DUF3815 family)